MADYGHWKSGKKLDPAGAVGFVYLIVNKIDGRMYLGKKFFRVRKGRNRGKPHAWKSYTSSSKELNIDIRKFGKDSFDFYIIEEYHTLGALSWAEIWSLVTQRIPEENGIWYNRRIDKVSWKVSEPVTDYHKRRLTYLVSKNKRRRKTSQ